MYARFSIGITAVVALLGAPAVLQAQELSAFSTPRGVEVRIVDLSYDIQGSTARQILDQMRGGGPGGGWVQFPYEYRWSYRTRQLASVSGRATLHCGVTDITIEFTVRADYPRWVTREDASPRLLEAWGLFEEQLEALWQERQDALVRFARDARREVLRIEEGCPIIQQIVNDRVQRSHDRSMEREQEARAEGERTRLRWPPEGYDDLMAVTPAQAAGQPPAGRGAAPAVPPGQRRPPPLPPEGSGAPTGGEVGIERVLVSDVGPGAMLGAVAGLVLAGETDYLGALGHSDFDEAEPLTAQSTMRLPGFTEVVINAVAAGLEAEGALDLDAPLGSYLPDLSPRLGAIPFRHLLERRSGIDDARPADSVWAEVLDDLDDRAVFTEPGVVTSYSRYDYPLAARVVEAAGGASLEELASRHLFGPASMEGSSLTPSEVGLPLTLTTAEDLLAFGAALSRGTVGPGIEGEAVTGGLRRDEPAGVRRWSLICEAGAGTDALAFQVYPDHDVAQVLWARPRSSARVWPATVARLMFEDLGGKLGLGPAIFEPRKLKGAAQLQTDPTLCDEPDWNPDVVGQAGEAVPAGEWAGRYTNGDRLVTFEARDGGLWITDDMALQVAAYEGDIHFATMNGVALYPIRLVTDDQGRRYAVLHGRAYLHDDDRTR